MYSKHPEPEVGAAMMVCDKFRPQLQAMLCNHSQAAKELDIDAALNDNQATGQFLARIDGFSFTFEKAKDLK